MRILTNKNFIQKLIIVIVLIILFNFCVPQRVYAVTTFGGTMMTYLRDFTKGIADVLGTLAQLGLTGKLIYAVDLQGTRRYIYFTTKRKILDKTRLF